MIHCKLSGGSKFYLDGVRSIHQLVGEEGWISWIDVPGENLILEEPGFVSDYRVFFYFLEILGIRFL